MMTSTSLFYTRHYSSALSATTINTRIFDEYLCCMLHYSLPVFGVTKQIVHATFPLCCRRAKFEAHVAGVKRSTRTR
jgi:hypothetical protein